MKKSFNSAELELICFEAEDVISTSGEPESTVPVLGLIPADKNWEAIHKNYKHTFPWLHPDCPICNPWCNKK